MTYESLADGGLNYFPCRYGTSRLLFRGPCRTLEGDYVVAIGGTETYGKFVEQPYPQLLEDEIGRTVVNFGAMNAGVDVFRSDQTVLEAAAGARAVVLQVMGAHNLSNRFYTVHPRRNDRFLKASTLLRVLYPEVDFTDFHFTRHLLQSLRDADPVRFEAVICEIQDAWLNRMSGLIRTLRAPVVLLWMADRDPDDPVDLGRASDPLFVTSEMLDALRPQVAGIVEARWSPAARNGGRAGMVFSQLEAAVASEVPNPVVHAETSAALAPIVRSLI